MTLRVFEAFAGVGAQSMALRNLGVDYETVAISEIDKFALSSYKAIHGNVLNLGDISQIETNDIPDHDLFTYSFPCQDISVAGKQAGLNMDAGTRSGLLWECQKIIATKRPKYLLLENVRNLVGKRHKANFDLWLEWLVAQGYTNYWKIINAKDFGIPQNRERVFVVSILGNHETFFFPEKQELHLRLKDVLEENVDEKYYLKSESAQKLLAIMTAENTIKDTVTCDASLATPKIKDISNCITARYDAGIQNKQSMGMSVIEPVINQIGQLNPEGSFGGNPQIGRVNSTTGISPTLSTMQGGNRQPKVLIKNATKQGYLVAHAGDGIDLAYPNSNTRRGRVQKESSPTLQTSDSVGTVEFPAIASSRGRNPENPSDRTVGSPTEQRLEINNKGVSNTLTTVLKDNYVLESNVLTPKRTEYGKAIRKDYENGLINESRHNMTAMQPRTDGISNTLTTVQKDNYVLEQGFRIRKLTPLECWRLMGFTDEDFYKAQAVNSNSQLYKQAGNSIVVPVLEGLFRNMLATEVAEREIA